jgi:hypothetical protein
MSNTAEILAAAVAHKPHSFQYIRKATGLTLSDEQLRAVAEGDRARFKLLRFLKRDDEGVRIQPGRPGVGLRRAGLL